MRVSVFRCDGCGVQATDSAGPSVPFLLLTLSKSIGAPNDTTLIHDRVGSPYSVERYTSAQFELCKGCTVRMLDAIGCKVSP